MPVICPKCSHVRPLDATNPDWQCPSCGVCYAKVSAGSAEPARPPRRAHANTGQGPRPGWLLLAIPLLALGWGVNSYIEHRGVQAAGVEALEARQQDTESGAAAIDVALQASGVEASQLKQMGGQLEKSCARNKYGLSESDCIERLHEREELCAASTAQRFPGQIGDSARLQTVALAYVGCIFEEE